MRVQFEEDQEIREISTSNIWKLRTTGEEEVDFDSLEVGGSVLAYCSPMTTFYDATVIRALYLHISICSITTVSESSGIVKVWGLEHIASCMHIGPSPNL